MVRRFGDCRGPCQFVLVRACLCQVLVSDTSGSLDRWLVELCAPSPSAEGASPLAPPVVLRVARKATNAVIKPATAVTSPVTALMIATVALTTTGSAPATESTASAAEG
jgi:hypothetical protein